MSGVFPLGIFMLVQLWVHAKAVAGPEAHRQALETLARVPARPLWQALILVPLAFHLGFGVVLALRPAYNTGRYPLSRNWTYFLQRASGLVALSFLALVAADLWIPAARGALAPADVHGELVRKLSATEAQVPWRAFAYVLGIAACTFHLACGLWTFSMRWGIAVRDAARTRAAALCVLFGLAVFALGARTVLHLATGWRIGGSPERDAATVCPPRSSASAASSTEGP